MNGGINTRNLESLDRLLGVTVEGSFRNDLQRADIERRKREEAGVSDVMRQRSGQIPSSGVKAEDYWRATGGALPGLYKQGKTGSEAADRLLRQTEVEVKGIPKEQEPEKPEAHKEIGSYTGKDDYLYTQMLDPNTNEYYYVGPGGRMNGMPPGARRTDPKGSPDVEKRRLDQKIAEKRGLERKILAKNRNINLDAILRGEASIPEEDEVKYESQLDIATGETKTVPVPTGKKVQDKDVARWIALIGETEELMGQRGEEFTPADEIAESRRAVSTSRLGGPQATIPQGAAGASGSATAPADNFEVGAVYKDAAGNRAKYLGNGKWEDQ